MDPLEKGTAIFLDVFRRADKNDDGALSWEEFKSFFADGVLTEEELRNLFNEIDTHNTNNIDTGELCSYFSQHLGPFRDVLGAIDELNVSISNALQKSAESYPSSAFVEQFLSRFLLREIATQLHAVQRPVDVASDTLDEQALLAKDIDKLPEESGQPQTANEEPVYRRAVSSDAVGAASAVTPGRFARRARRQQGHTPTAWGMEIGSPGELGKQVDRLQHLIDRMENKVKLDGGPEEIVDITDEKMIHIVHSRMTVHSEKVKAFKNSLRNYIEFTNEDSTCLHLCIRSYSGTNLFRTYEVWESQEAWKNHVAQEGHRTFQHAKVDLLEVPEQVNTMQIPASWWKQDE